VQSEIRIGQVLMEDIRFGPDSGQLLTGAFMDYAVPRADTLSAIHCESNPVPTETNPLGVKDAVKPAMSVHYRRSATR
jgi:carbon-monoxide dehydrogenase large subunit